MKIYSDGSSIDEIKPLIDKYDIQGFTTNPSLMKKIGVKDYELYCKSFIEHSGGLPVSFEVFSGWLWEYEKTSHKNK